MANEKSDFLSPGDPIVIVKKMTKEVVEAAIQAYAEDDAYYLKFYSAELDTKTLDVLNNRYIARDKFGAGVTIAASVVAPNPATIGGAIHLVSEIYENC